ncbi:Fe-S cluster assembly protein SufD [Thermococcus sp. M39]|uniref:SufD family Fe-S cluster assembly protein n=1 Tax=unclassified Thermococcus TaxID=2627626 RepID=UPI001438EED8|nr:MULTISPECIES: SufD family Fe-S cluster assembly protein [unclassified Thermococcus]NJE09016.1 Fe-S cluster assembly protein SufD [Thermococcus sp. M39]NJE13319.1 Fe-S cluster assembly protein SufD [Thermococcus sp. LS2]
MRSIELSDKPFDKRFEKLKKLEYQKYGDSPTIKSYTKWKLFEENSPLRLPTEAKAGEVKIKAHVLLSGSEASFNLPKGIVLEEGTLGLSSPEESRILGFHFYTLKKAYKLRIVEDLKEPLVIVSHLSEKGFISHHVSIEAENVKAPIVIYDLSEKGTKSLVIELKAKNSDLEILTIGRHSALSYYLMRASLGDNTRVKAFTLVKGGEMSHHREDYSLEGRETELILRGMPIGIGSAVDYLTNVLQYSEKSKSETKIHGFSYQKGWTVHRGIAKVFESARNASSRVISQVTIMDEGSLGVSVPMLEVDTSEIEEASHSSAVHQFDEDALFYLRSRGLDRKEALSLFIHGIGEALTEHLEELKEKARKNIKGTILALL